MKKKLLILISLFAAATLAGTAAAYLTDGDKRPNSLTVGSVETEIKERFVNPGTPDPGDVITKEVAVTSTGLNDCYVRVQVLFSDLEMRTAGTVDWNTQDWVYLADTAGADWNEDSTGWWYFRDVLHPGETTPNLFETVTISDTAAQVRNFDVFIRQESRQASGYGSFAAAWQ